MDSTVDATVEETVDDQMQKQFSASRWSHRLPAEAVVSKHIEVITEGSKTALQEILNHDLGVSYGPSDKQICDIFYPSSEFIEAPVMVFIHGGLWQAMSPSMYRSIARGFTAEGVQVVLAGYDLAPIVTIAQMELEMKLLSQFILKKAGQTNSGVWFCGHSAGAHLVSTLFSFQEAVSNPLFKGAILISGLYDLTPLLKTSYNDALKLDRKAAIEASPAFRSQLSTNLKIMMVIAEHDAPAFKQQSKEFYKLLKNRSNTVEMTEIKNVDHFDIVEKLSNPEFELTVKINTLIKTGEFV